jgi:hypothetical protein
MNQYKAAQIEIAYTNQNSYGEETFPIVSCPKGLQQVSRYRI